MTNFSSKMDHMGFYGPVAVTESDSSIITCFPSVCCVPPVSDEISFKSELEALFVLMIIKTAPMIVAMTTPTITNFDFIKSKKTLKNLSILEYLKSFV